MIYKGVTVKLLCHKCGEPMEHDAIKRQCEYCGHELGMWPRMIDDNEIIFEVVI
jgi:DNA-directed RNA polymerase subunit RPC12/RpoP